MEKEKKGLFGRLLDFLKGKSETEMADGIGFWNDGEIVEKHFAEKITVAKLARMLCMSEDHFGHLFREAVGRSPLQFINDIRLRKAANLLETEEFSVTEVAAAVGFSDYNHFGRLFRKRYGCTPNQVRRGLFHVFEENETAE